MTPDVRLGERGGPLYAEVLDELRFAIRETVRAAAWLTALASAVGGLAALFGWADPRLDLAAHVAPLWFAAGLAAALTGALVERRRFKWPVVLGLVGALASGAMIAPELMAARPTTAVPAGSETLTVVQLNLWGANRDLPRTARWLLEQDADVVVLEEAASSPVLALLKDRYPHQITCVHPHSCAPMILLKTAPSAHGAVQTAPESLLNWVTIGADRPFTLAAVHQLKPYDPLQPRQVALAARRLAAFDRETLVVAGDFNSTPWSWSMRRQDKLFGLRRLTRAMPTWPTWAPFPLLPIDHVYAGEAWRPAEVRRGPGIGSDHYPLVFTLTRDG